MTQIDRRIHPARRPARGGVSVRCFPRRAAIEGLEARTLFDAGLVANTAEDVSVDDVQLRTYVMGHEGLSQHAFRDPETGRAKVGFGFDLRRRGARQLLESLGLDRAQLLREARTEPAELALDMPQAIELFNADVAIAIDAARSTLDGFDELSHRQQV